jgi:polyhydroxyalkanoate synthesis regulator phasin
MAKQEFDAISSLDSFCTSKEAGAMTPEESKEFMEMVQRELKEMRKLIEDCKEQLKIVNKNRPFIVQ